MLEVLALRVRVVVQLHETEITALLDQITLDHVLRYR